MLEVLKDDHLEHADDLTVKVGDEDLTTTGARLGDGGPVGLDVVLVFLVWKIRAALDDERRGAKVALLDRTNQGRHALRARVNRREDADALFDRLGGVQAEVLAQQVADDLHARG